jgi:hypothetical protein
MFILIFVLGYGAGAATISLLDYITKKTELE